MATLARIITGDVQIEAHSLQQAFAEANASLRQANTIIGDYQIVEEEVDDVVVGGNGHVNGSNQLPTLPLRSTQPLNGPTALGKPVQPLLVPERPALNGRNGRSPEQPSLFNNGHAQGKTNGAGGDAKAVSEKPSKQDKDNAADRIPVVNRPVPPAVPRPRLLAS